MAFSSLLDPCAGGTTARPPCAQAVRRATVRDAPFAYSIHPARPYQYANEDSDGTGASVVRLEVVPPNVRIANQV
jgi:hypothetical protein